MARRALIRQIGDIDIRLLRIFVTVWECGGLAASEFELNIGRSTISKHLSDLETRLGIRLCNRGPGGFVLTTEGERVLQAIRRLFAALDSFQGEVDEIHANLTGTLRLGLFDQSTTNPEAHLHEAIKGFDVEAPDVDLEIFIEPPNVIEARVIEGTLDIGIVPVHRQSGSLSYLPLYDERMTLFCGRGHPLFGQEGTQAYGAPEFRAHKYAGFGFNSPNMSAGQKLGLRRAAKVQDEEALSLLIQSGRYLGFLADHVAEGFLARGEVWPVEPEETRYVSHFAAITKKSPQSNRKTDTMLAKLAAVHSG